MKERKATKRQDNPTREKIGVDVSRELQKDLQGKGAEKEVIASICQDLEARIEEAKKEYGERLTTWNNRDCMLDAYQEVLDLLHYLKQAHLEGKVEDHDFRTLKGDLFLIARFFNIKVYESERKEKAEKNA